MYHTKHDSFEKIPSGSYQHIGDNLLALVRSLSNSADLPKATLTSTEKSVYFDVIGLFAISYSENTALIVNTVAIVVSGLLFLKLFYDNRQSKYIK